MLVVVCVHSGSDGLSGKRSLATIELMFWFQICISHDYGFFKS